MTTYSINIDYTTGDSFGSERQFREVGMNWQSLDQAKKALVCIQEHYAAYKKCNSANSSSWYRENEPFELSDISDKSWYHGPLDADSWPDAWQHTVVIEKDDGVDFAIAAFWVGYFETLHMAEVCIAADSEKENDDMRIYF
jgi:hypothetical protein